MKNIIYGEPGSRAGGARLSGPGAALAKTSPHALHTELFALHIGIFMLQKYAHLRKAFVEIERLKWTRIRVDGKEHAHAFVRDGDEREVTSVEVRCFCSLRAD